MDILPIEITGASLSSLRGLGEVRVDGFLNVLMPCEPSRALLQKENKNFNRSLRLTHLERLIMSSLHGG
jgi:hypothetical protein